MSLLLALTGAAGVPVTINCGTAAASAAGFTATITAGGASPDPRLDAILALLTGTKVYDAATGLWRVYAPDNTELADESGVLMRGLHGWMLAPTSSLRDSNWLVVARRRNRR